ncbi:MAG: hypothetical protein Q8R20_01505 [Nanoarchaeota archaeon]|nr:hypothetical protein [Nanoarchaeota archaeon]
MKAVINIKTDRVIKEKAQKVARELGMPLSTIINGYLGQLVRTKEVYFFLEGELKPSVKKRLDRLHQDVKEGKNLSPVFRSATEMDAYLNSL